MKYPSVERLKNWNIQVLKHGKIKALKHVLEHKYECNESLDNNIFAHPSIYGVTILTKHTYIQTLTNNSRTLIDLPRYGYRSCVVANIDGTDAVACTLELHDGSTYTKLLDQISIPAKASLVLNEDEIAFDEKSYNLHATSGDSGGQLTFTFNY